MSGRIGCASASLIFLFFCTMLVSSTSAVGLAAADAAGASADSSGLKFRARSVETVSGS